MRRSPHGFVTLELMLRRAPRLPYRTWASEEAAARSQAGRSGVR